MILTVHRTKKSPGPLPFRGRRGGGPTPSKLGGGLDPLLPQASQKSLRAADPPHAGPLKSSWGQSGEAGLDQRKGSKMSKKMPVGNSTTIFFWLKSPTQLKKKIKKMLIFELFERFSCRKHHNVKKCANTYTDGC